MTNKPDIVANTEEPAEDRADAPREREAVSDGASRRGGILAGLRRSPLVGADLDLVRIHAEARDIDL